jgi:hypothetical protein
MLGAQSRTGTTAASSSTRADAIPGGLRLLGSLGVAMAVMLALLVALDLAVSAWFPHFDRVSDNFSAAYLSREVDWLAHEPPTAVFLGDSVLWGYKLPADDAAPTLLRRKGLVAENLSFEGGSPANTYAMLRLLELRGVHPRLVVFNVNQKEFSAADSAYQKLHPSLETLVWNDLTPDERKLLTPTPPSTTQKPIEVTLDRWVTSVWHFYALRSDMREAIFGDVDAVHALDDVIQKYSGAKARDAAAHKPTPDRFEGTYDLSPIDAQNVSLIFLKKTLALLQRDKVPAIAILTPTNHTLLHEFIDVPEYQRNLAFTRKLLESAGVRVVDMDRTFTAPEFIDNDHLTAPGNRRFASLLGPVLAQ